MESFCRMPSSDGSIHATIWNCIPEYGMSHDLHKPQIEIFQAFQKRLSKWCFKMQRINTRAQQ